MNVERICEYTIKCNPTLYRNLSTDSIVCNLGDKEIVRVIVTKLKRLINSAQLNESASRRFV